MDRITRAIPRPRTIILGGRSFVVHEGRLLDLADLQAWIDSLFANPLAIAGPLLRDPDLSPEAKDAILFEIEDVYGDGPPAWGSPESSNIMASQEGISVFLWVSLRRGNPDFTPEQAASLSSQISTDEYHQLARIFWGDEVGEEIDELIVGDMKPKPKGGRKKTWGESIDAVAKDHGWTYETVHNLTIREWKLACTGEDEQGVAVDASLAKSLQSRRERAAEWVDRHGRAILDFVKSSVCPGRLRGETE